MRQSAPGSVSSTGQPLTTPSASSTGEGEAVVPIALPPPPVATGRVSPVLVREGSPLLASMRLLAAQRRAAPPTPAVAAAALVPVCEQEAVLDLSAVVPQEMAASPPPPQPETTSGRPTTATIATQTPDSRETAPTSTQTEKADHSSISIPRSVPGEYMSNKTPREEGVDPRAVVNFILR